MLLFLSAPVRAELVELYCEHDEGKSVDDGSLLRFTDSAFDLTVDLGSKSVSSKRYPKFRDRDYDYEITVRDGFIIWSAERESPGPRGTITYRLSRYTGHLHVSITDVDKGDAIATGQCVKKKRLF